MGKFLRRTSACVLAASLTMTGLVFGGCSKKDASAKTITEDMPWYDLKEIVVGQEYREMDTQYLDVRLMGKYGDGVLMSIIAYLNTPADFDWENGDYSEFEKDIVEYYDMDGNLIKSLDIAEAIRTQCSDLDDAYLRDIKLIGDEIVATIMSGDGDYNTVVNLDDGSFGELVPVSGTDGSNSLDQMRFAESTLQMGDKQLIVYDKFDNDGIYSFEFDVVSPDGDTVTIDPSTVGDMSFLGSLIKIDDTHALVCPTSYMNESGKYYVVDTDQCTIEEYTADTDWLKTVDTDNIRYFDGIGNVVANQQGLQILDFDSKSLEDIFSFDSCNINRFDIMNLELVDYTGDTIVFVGTTYNGYGYFLEGEEETTIKILTKNDTNPNAGKTLINAASIYPLDYVTAEALSVFNETNENYFIMMDPRFDRDTFVRERISELGDADEDQISSAFENELMIELMSGDGPDLLLNATSMSQLNNSEYLTDLSSIVPDEGYFTNIFDAASEDGKLYQIPLSFGMEGITVNKDLVDQDKIGFTFDEYDDFVSQKCNGDDPVEMTRLQFFQNCLAVSGELFDNENGYDFNNEAFRALAEYVQGRVEPIEVPDDDGVVISYLYDGIKGAEMANAQYGYIYAFPQFLQDFSGIVDDVKLMGFPSVDGRGPNAFVCASAAVRAESACQEGCFEFIELMLGDDMQDLFASDMSTPVKISAFEKDATANIEAYNEKIDNTSLYYSQAEMITNNFLTEHIDESVIDTYEEMIGSISCIYKMDSSVLLILNEEIPAYFEGQKTLDDVLDIIENRVTTLINERE